MRTLLGPSGVVIGLVGLFLGIRSLVSSDGSIALALAALGLIAVGLLLLRFDEAASRRRR